MSSERPDITREMIIDLLSGNKDYVQQFTEATSKSFNEFLKKYRAHLANRDLSALREAGHKIKPVCQMLNLNAVIEEYEQAKTLLNDDSTTQQQLEASVQRMEKQVSNIQATLDKIE